MLHIVFVDDNPDFLDLMVQELEGAEVKVSVLLDRANIDLISQIEALNPDILFMDIFLLSIEITILFQLIQANEKLRSIPIYLLSYTDEADIQSTAMNIGATGGFSKPLHTEEVLGIIAKHSK